MTESYLFFALTLLAYWGSIVAVKRLKLNNLPPLIPALVLLILFLVATGTSYSRYMIGGQYIHFWLGPATVALGLALYRQRQVLLNNLKPVLLGSLAGTVTVMVSTVALSRLLGLEFTLATSMLTKSVTTPVALAISENIGGVPPLAAAMVVITGNLGGAVGLKLMTMAKINSPIARGLAMGNVAHALGTATALRENETAGAIGGVALIVAAILTAILAPLLAILLG